MYHYYPAAHMTHPFCYYPSPMPPARYPPGLFMRPDDANLYTTLEQTMSSNPNVYFQRGVVHPGMMY
uniref:CSON008426 protein n=2 Tax=Culicoides TaxID=41820 RepID=A0A336MWU0_CULSO